MTSTSISQWKSDMKQKRKELETLEDLKQDLLRDDMNPFRDKELQDVEETMQLCNEEIDDLQLAYTSKII